jgi:thymidylate kinase
MSTKYNIPKILTGRLFVFEGMDGVGKSTLAKNVANELQKNKTDVLLLSFPGNESKTLGNLIYSLHHNTASLGIDNISPTSLQALHIAAHIDCIENRILPALADGKTVILDRYWWSTVVYGMTSGIARKVLCAMVDLEKIVWGNVKPNKLFFITRNKPFRVELSEEQWSALLKAYEILAVEEKINHPIETIVNSSSLEKVVHIILSRIQDIPVTKYKEKSLENKQTPLLFHGHMSLKVKDTNRYHWLPTRPTEVFDTYWRFAAERQAIFFRRLSKEKMPWTDDNILWNYKFTNAYRASDRVSQFLIRHVIYDGPQEPDEIFFRIILFKTFNKIETWQLLVGDLGYISWREYDFRIYDKILTTAQESKKPIYSAAYIMPSGARSFGHQVKHRNHLQLIQNMMADNLPSKVCDSKSMQEVFDLLRNYPMIGDFLAYQYATDINYSILTDFNEMSFVVPGPGAKDGIRKCFSDFGGLTEVDLIKLMADRQRDEFSRLNLEFKDLWGRPLQLIDCQNLFCEVDKYARIAHPEIKGLTGRSKIKQKFKPTPEIIEYFYPPKWKINDAVNNILEKKLSFVGS